ncbi:MAG: competence protein CoiA [Bacteroidales bacterium]|nr:competence protein CoiA [Bacteroidales bacterium]
MEILYKYAETNNGNIIFIENALSGEKYHCPVCKEELIFRNGKIRQKHFCHKNKTNNCGNGGGEGYLHETFKKMLFNYILESIKNNTPLEIFWICNICKKEHNGNLILGISEIKMEYSLEKCRPDLVLINEQGNASIIIEVVDKHEPENNVLEYCSKNNTVLIRIKLDSIEDLENVENKIKTPSNLVFFNQMNCINYVNYVNSIQQRNNINYQLSPNYSNVRRSGPSIEEIEANRTSRIRQQYAIKNYYKSKGRRK